MTKPIRLIDRVTAKQYDYLESGPYETPILLIASIFVIIVPFSIREFLLFSFLTISECVLSHTSVSKV